MRRLLCLVLAALAALLSLAPPAGAATVTGRWRMGTVHSTVVDRAGRSNLHLSGGWRGVAGSVGRAVEFRWTGRASGGAVHSVTAFNPGASRFAVAVTLKAQAVPAGRGYSPNVVQKGLFDDRGQWKLELIHESSGTVARCRFSGTRGHHTILDHTGRRLNDGRWHEVACWRTRSAYGISVDGAKTYRRGTVGVISNSRPFRVAAKSPGSGIRDQFQGTLDCVAYTQGRRPLRLALKQVPC